MYGLEVSLFIYNDEDLRCLFLSAHSAGPVSFAFSEQYFVERSTRHIQHQPTTMTIRYLPRDDGGSIREQHGQTWTIEVQGRRYRRQGRKETHISTGKTQKVQR